ncbi:WD40 repeat domain-containing protein [Ktedonobacter racemifer]|uniref:WD40 repeat protein n=1 Tax=Ktedonobacter racemifer DSM 44963 TaxID=485913 RepID=D6TKB7_KTERA|nr:hypothetical protein [Ktedonobacter racemifer]EFH86217.1 WD40 repeat protein [Ktedonobacter racemifer DSM 44963]
MMAEHKDFFLPGQVDEQIEQLLHEGGPKQREQRLTRSLPTLMREHEDQQSLQRVLNKLHSNLNATTPQSTNIVSLPQQRQQRGINAGNAPAGRKPRTLPRAFTLLAACLVLVAVVGSLLLVLNAAQQKRNAPGNTAAHTQTPAPQKTAPSEPLGKVIYRSDIYDMDYGLHWSPDGKRLAASLNRTTLTSWDAKTGAHKLTYQTPGETLLSDIAWSPDGKNLLVVAQSKIYVFDAQTTQRIRIITLPNGTASTNAPLLSSPTPHGTFYSNLVSLSGGSYFSDLTLSPDDKYIAASYHAYGANNPLFIWNVKDGTLFKTLYDFPHGLTGLSWSPDSASLVTLVYPSAQDAQISTAIIWNTNTWTQVWQRPNTRNVSWSPDSQRLAVVDGEGATGMGIAIQLVNAHTGQAIKQLKAERGITSINWSPDGSRIEVEAVGLQILDASNGSILYTFGEHGYNGTWSPNGKYIASSQIVIVTGDDKKQHHEGRILVWVAR